MTKTDALKHLFASALIAVGLCGPATAEDSSPAVVVELFTSQGCSSCPPAEAFLGDLASRDGVVALEYHIDYWDYIGWADPYAEAVFTDRQRRYAAQLGSRYVYTPQMVIDGAAHDVGSDRSAILALIDQSRRLRKNSPMIDIGPVVLGSHTVTFSVSGPTLVEPYDIVLVTYDSIHTTEIKRGENRGKVLENYNVVRALAKIGEWRGGSLTQSVDLSGMKGDGGCAVLIQQPDNGPILAAAKAAY